VITARAVAREDGTYAVSGQKTFISAGDHDLTDHIVHLVLARLQDAPSWRSASRGCDGFYEWAFAIRGGRKRTRRRTGSVILPRKARDRALLPPPSPAQATALWL
jgi:hypothetical protein